MQAKDHVRIEHMVDAAQTALAFVEGRERTDLETDVMLRFAVVHAIGIVGEAAANVSAEGRAEAPAVPWKQIVGMRNRIVHRYVDIDNDIVWATLESELPALLPLLRAVLSNP